MNVLQRHAALRRALVVGEQVICAAIIYTLAGVVWRNLGGSGRHPGLVTVICATAVVAVMLALTRPWFERAVNWLAYGERADGYELASRFLTRLATTLDVDDVLPRLAETVARSVGSRRGEVRVWLADGNTWRQTWPEDTAEHASDVAVAVHHGGTPVGQMAVGLDPTELSADHRSLLDQLAGPAGLAMSTVRLTQALRQQADDIQVTAVKIEGSRQRILGSRRAEQERFKGQLARRVQPYLDAASVALADPDSVTDSDLAAAGDQVSRALDELRNLARGLFPAGLQDVGLAEALTSWSERNHLALSVSSTGDLARLQAHPDLIAALYFCAVSALSTSGGQPATATAGIDGEARIAIGVDDSGVSLDVLASGVGSTDYQALADRAEAFGGSVAVEPAPEAKLSVRIPLESRSPI